MKPEADAALAGVLKRLVGYLVVGDFAAVDRMTNGVRLSATEVQLAVTEYGGTLVCPPDTAFEQLDAIKVEGSNPRRWSVCFDLWTEHEGRSDLSLELTVEEGSTPLKVELDDIHVL